MSNNFSDLSFEFEKLLPSLPFEGNSAYFNGIAIGDSKAHCLAKSSMGWPIILVSTSYGFTALPPRLDLQYISVRHGCKGKVRTLSDTINGTYTIVECLKEGDSITRSFIWFAIHLCSAFPSPPEPRAVALELNNLVKMFQAVRRPASKSVQGLWSELFIIFNSPNTPLWAKAWHDDPLERYDFAFSDGRVEAKSSANRIRRHFFSHYQLHPPTGVNLWIASVFVERCSGGLTIGNLLGKIQKQVDATTAFKLELIVIESLGQDYERALTLGFDESLAKQSLRFADSENVPRLEEPLPDDISDVKYCVFLAEECSMSEKYPIP